jgi:hypothetical protein
MKALKYGFGLILVGGFALTASCGGSSGDDSSSAAGATSSAGTNSAAGTGTGTGGTDIGIGTGGTGTGTAGTGTGTGGTGTGTGGTGTGTGGAGTGTGGAGTGTGGAAAMNPAGCPAATTTPKTGNSCTAGMNGRPVACAYAAADPGEDTTCECAPARGGGRGPGGGAAGAPDVMDTLTCATTCAAHTSTPPVTGDACSLTGFATTCTFGPNARTNTDRCRCAMAKWTCTTIGGMGAAGAPG